jgi:hypothetical protein
MTENPSLAKQFKEFLFGTAKIVAAVSVICTPIAYLVAPVIDAYVDDKITSFIEQLPEQGPRDVLEFKGNGIVLKDGPVKPGEVVPIVFLLKSNSNCHRLVEMRWINEQGVVQTNLTETVVATQAQRNTDFTTFPVYVTIPMEAPDGLFLYAAIVRVPDCKGFKDQTVVPLSTPIRVKR